MIAGVVLSLVALFGFVTYLIGVQVGQVRGFYKGIKFMGMFS